MNSAFCIAECDLQLKTINVFLLEHYGYKYDIMDRYIMLHMVLIFIFSGSLLYVRLKNPD